jgi:glycosyltransferase involved in cell wall biosynthesis
VSKGMTLENYDLFKSLSAKKENPNAIQIYHCIPELFRRIKRKCRSLAICAFEARPAPKNWILSLNKMDGVVFSSQFCYDNFEINKPKIVIPHCLDFERYKYTAPKQNNDFIFLFCGTKKKRKGLDILLTAWKEEQLYKEGCSLYLKTPSFGNPLDTNAFSDFKITHDKNVYNDEEMQKVFTKSDCYISTSSGEGFGYCGLQSLACGRPIITLNYGGCKEYANSAYCFLLEPEGFITPNSPMDKYVQFKGCQWPFISVKQIRRTIRKAFTQYRIAAEALKTGYKSISIDFGYLRCSNRFEAFIKGIYENDS